MGSKVKGSLQFILIVLTWLLTAEQGAAFTIQIDARTLSSTGFVISGKTDFIDGTIVQKLDLPRGTYSLQPGSGFVMACSFSVTSEGRIDFEPACDPFLSGRGTVTLVVRGHAIKIDARALASTGFELTNVFGLANRLTPSTDVQTLTLVPFDGYLFQVGAGIIGQFSWGIDRAGRITYDPAFDPFLSGRGTDTLVVRGHAIKIDARVLASTGFELTNVFGLANRLTPSTDVQTLTLVPVQGSYVFQSGAGNATFEWDIDHECHITYAPGLEGSVFGLGTDTLHVNRRVCVSHVVTGFILDKWKSL